MTSQKIKYIKSEESNFFFNFIQIGVGKRRKVWEKREVDPITWRTETDSASFQLELTNRNSWSRVTTIPPSHVGRYIYASCNSNTCAFPFPFFFTILRHPFFSTRFICAQYINKYNPCWLIRRWKIWDHGWWLILNLNNLKRKQDR